MEMEYNYIVMWNNRYPIKRQEILMVLMLHSLKNILGELKQEVQPKLQELNMKTFTF